MSEPKRDFDFSAATLIIVDVQNDFLPGGALQVPQGDRVIQPINRLQSMVQRVVATQDWHPPDHQSFAAQHSGHSPGDVIDLHGLQQILWPVHCVRGTPGAQFATHLDLRRIERIFTKGEDPRIDSYSGFFDNGHTRSTGLGEYLRWFQVEEVLICGLALDVCVKYTALDAVQLGFTTRVIGEACRAVNLEPGDGQAAMAEMRDGGIDVIEGGPWVEAV